MRAFLALCLLLPVPAGAVPVTFNYDLPCYSRCGEVGGDTANVSITFDNAGYKRFSRFTASSLVDFSVSSGSFIGNLDNMILTDFVGRWAAKKNDLPVFGLLASEDGAGGQIGSAIEILGPSFGGSRVANLWSHDASGTQKFTQFIGTPVPVPLPPAAGLIAAAMAMLGLLKARARFRSGDKRTAPDSSWPMAAG